MSYPEEGGNGVNMPHQQNQKKYKGVRRRKWGKWVSEIRVPGTQERLWLGSYVTSEAAAVAHDIASYCLRETSSPDKLNLPLMLPANVQRGMSPRSVQKAATDAGMAIDAQQISGYKIDNNIPSFGTEEPGPPCLEQISGYKIDNNIPSFGTGEPGSPYLDDGLCSSWDAHEQSEGSDLDITIDDYL